MLKDFILKKIKEAEYKILEDKTYFASIPDIKGVWACSANLEECRKELFEVLEDWILLKIKSGEYIPGISQKIGKKIPSYAK